MRETLTTQQERVLGFIEESVSDRGFPPSVREVCEYLNVTSSSTAHAHIKALVRKGYLRQIPGSPRAMSVVAQ